MKKTEKAERAMSAMEYCLLEPVRESGRESADWPKLRISLLKMPVFTGKRYASKRVKVQVTFP